MKNESTTCSSLSELCSLGFNPFLGTKNGFILRGPISIKFCKTLITNYL